jgi:tRNASer (uridine44-2'-O)-methyltransferase
VRTSIVLLQEKVETDRRCGNGLLTHILISEGYAGIGIDLRARSSWEHYPPSTCAALKVHAFDPISDKSPAYFKPGAFIIGNHADELTPWIPVVSTLYNASGYISIPCCSWAFDAKYDRSTAVNYPIPNDDFANSLNLGGDGSHKSSYSMYRIWLASLSLHCGWEVECEMLRIPSTRNWAIIGKQESFISPQIFIGLPRQKICGIMF